MRLSCNALVVLRIIVAVGVFWLALGAHRLGRFLFVVIPLVLLFLIGGRTRIILAVSVTWFVRVAGASRMRDHHGDNNNKKKKLKPQPKNNGDTK